MRVTITDVADVKDALLAAGLTLWLGQIDGVTVDAPSAALSLNMQPTQMATEAPVTPPAVRRKVNRKAEKPVAANTPKTKSAKSAAEDAPRLTIRQRIIEVLKSGPKGSVQVAAALRAQGIDTDATLCGQHLYLMTRDGKTEKDSENTWRLAA